MPSTVMPRRSPIWATQPFQLSFLSPMVVVTSGPPFQNAPLVSSHTRFRVVDRAPWAASKSRVGSPSLSKSLGWASSSTPSRTLLPAVKRGDRLMPVLPPRWYSPAAAFLYSNRVSTSPVMSTGAAKAMGAASAKTSAVTRTTAVFLMVIPLGFCDDAATHRLVYWDEGCDGCGIVRPRRGKRPGNRESPRFLTGCPGPSVVRCWLRRLIARSGRLGVGGLAHLLPLPQARPCRETGKPVTSVRRTSAGQQKGALPVASPP